MKLRKYLSILSLLLLFCSLVGFTFLRYQEDPFITRLKADVGSYFKNKPWEKAYLHIDKPFYKPGEDIWFKVYLTDGTNFKPSPVSDIIYVELVNPKGSVEKQLTLRTIQGICFGTFAIDESAPGGIYKIKAYTNWMKNFGGDYIFEKDIQVQKIVYPRLLAKLDFKKENYAPGDSVIAEIKMETLENEPLSFRSIAIDVLLGGVINQSLAATTDKSGKAFVSFILPADLKTNDGLLNAKVEHEGNMEAISRAIPIVLNNISLQFFPEGGYMIADVPATVAFKALNEFGKPADIEGYITDENDNRIAGFSSFHQGMGSFTFTPAKSKRYIAYITKPSIKTKFELPEVAPNGYAIHLENTGKEQFALKYYTPSAEKVHIVIQSGNAVQFSKTVDANKGENQLAFSSAKFPAGMGFLTLFDEEGMPCCERLVFFNYHRSMTISLRFDKEKYAPREKVKLRIHTYDGDSIPVAANLSLAVINDQMHTFADDKQHNILSWLLLGAEVKGKVEEPRFYFDPEEPKAEKALDYLLLTQGWRRYKWYQVTGFNYDVAYMPEKIGIISGRVMNTQTQAPVKAEVTAIELNNKRRVLKVVTADDGQFTFEGVDPTSSIQILANSKETDALHLKIEIGQGNAGLQGKTTDNMNMVRTLLPELIRVKPAEKPVDKGNPVIDNIEPGPETNGVNLTPDAKKLEEVVVVGYGTMRKSDLTGSVVSVSNYDINKINASVAQALQGRASGVEVVSGSVSPGASSQIRIRGTHSISNDNFPLVVIDGVVYDPAISGSSAPLQNIPVDQISGIEVLKDASSSAIYGNRAVNGVIVITTTNDWGAFKTIKRNYKPRYTGAFIAPRSISVTKEFYYPVYEDQEIPEVREDFRSTVYWNPNINTNQAGEAEVEFYNSDEITSFRAIAEGISRNGYLGHAEKKYFAQLPFSMAVKFPAYLMFNDTVNMPLIIKNNSSKVIRGKFDFGIPSCLKPIITLPDSISIQPNDVFTLYIPLEVQNVEGSETLTIAFNGGKYKDAFTQEINVQSKGFPTKLSFAGREKERRFSFHINKPVKGSVKGRLTVYPDLLSDMMAGVESILHEPYGCFEQTSSSTYPNILALSFMKETGMVNPEIEKKAMTYIHMGYKRLIGFETSEHGFEWFGHAPGQLGLTAYGLMEFTDMKAVYNHVDENMIQRTIQWILKKRDGRGGFKENGYQFSHAGYEVSNAYVLYALSEVGINECEPEYKQAIEEALLSNDPYRLGLMANTAYNLNQAETGNKLLERITMQLNKTWWNDIRIDHSITSSWGKSLNVETASLYVLALLKAPQKDWNLIDKTMNYIIASRSYGGFGSTQATIMALKALKEIAKVSNKISENGTIAIDINGTTAATFDYEKGDKGKLVLGALERCFKEGENNVIVKYTKTGAPLPFSFDAQWNALTPQSDTACKVDIETSVAKQHVKMAETVRLSVTLQNKTATGLPMTLAIIGIPSGLSVQPWQLKEYQEKGMFDFYEISKNYLVLYYRHMKPSEAKALVFDLKTEIPGSYQAPASTAYLYYTNELKDWEGGEEVRIDN
jgi:alpha-2-macroglobulin-like protein